MNHGIDGLSLYDDGSIGLGGTAVPLGAEFPAVQLGDWTLSKALGERMPLTASRGDGQRLVFQYRDGSWWKSETDSTRGLSRRSRSGREQNRSITREELKQLASLPLESFHKVSVHDFVNWCMGQTAPAFQDGEVSLYWNGTVVLGNEAFPIDEPLAGNRFGQSFAYRDWREDGSTVLVIVTPRGIRWYHGIPAGSQVFPYPNPSKDARYDVEDWRPPWWTWRFSDSTRGPRRSALTFVNPLYVAADRTIYVPARPREAEGERLVVLKQRSWPFWPKTIGTFIEVSPDEDLPAYTVISDYRRLELWNSEGRIFMERHGTYSPDDNCMVIFGRHSMTRAWRDLWYWYQLYPRQGAVNLPRLEGRPPSQLSG